MHDPWMERLSEYLDGEMDRAGRESLEAHLKTCAECAAALEELREVRARARELRDQPVPAALWPRIEEAIAGGGALAPSAAPVRVTRLGSPRARRFSLPELLAACLAVGIVSGASVFAVVRHLPPAKPPATVARAPESPASPGAASERTETPAEREAPPPVTAVPAARSDADLGRANRIAETPNEEAIAELRKVLARERDRLDPATIRTLEANLAIIDLAIDQAKRALAADPADTYVKEHLAETMRRKVELLQRATLLASTSNLEGTR